MTAASVTQANIAYRKVSRENLKKQSKLSLRGKVKAEKEGMILAEILVDLKNELDYLYNNFDNLTDPILVDGCIYEIKALHMKYQYFLKLCKEKNLPMKDIGYARPGVMVE